MIATVRYHGIRSQAILLPLDYRGNTPCVVTGHGHNGTGQVPVPGYGAWVYGSWVRAGWPVIICSTGNTWGNDSATAELDAGLDYMESTYGCVGPHFVYGFSMGGMTALNYVVRHRERVRALALAGPALDLEYQHDSNFHTYGTAELRAAYGGTAETFNAYRESHNPVKVLAGIGEGAQYQEALTSLPTYLAYDPLDDVSPPEAFAQFANAVDSVRSGDYGHTPEAVDSMALLDFWRATL
jgi:pimeloyl-ACP methyl ester carboxylesterase